MSNNLNWINHIKKNGNLALKEVYTLYREECMSWLGVNLSINKEIAKDAFQMATLILYQNVMTGKLTELKSELKTYLFAIARNKALELKRKEHLSTSETKLDLIIEDLTGGISEKHKFEKLINTVNTALLHLGDPCKTILQLYYFKKMRLAEIAILVGHKNSKTTKTKKHKCIQRLSTIVHKSKIVSFESH